MTITGTKRSEIEGERLQKDESKRSKSTANPNDDAKIAVNTKILNEYQGYSFQQEESTTPLTIDVVPTSSLSATTFFEKYVRQRKPCILDGLPTSNDTPMTITRELLEQVAGDKVIQVEKRFHADENFGQNRTSTRQVQFTICDFLKALLDDTASKDSKDSKNGELLYWSTQEDTDDPFNVPCRQLVNQHHIPAHLPLAGNLVLSSCNLWMGASQEGASSGLHHDYHDNFYILLHGKKRFRLLSPDCAPKLHVHGTIERIYPNGRVSYVGNEARADGVPMASLEEEELEDEDDDDDEEEEIVLGKGFDYVSDGDDDDDDKAAFDETNQTDDFDEIMNGSEADDKDDKPREESQTSDKKQNGDNNNKKKDDDDEHPDSFSRINPCRTDEAALHQEFPSFASCRQVMAEIKEGQMLYLPAGWFHEVTSYSNTDAAKSATTTPSSGFEGQCHMALNYWYHPPDALDNFGNPYQDDFWRKEEQHRLKAQRAKQD